MTFTGVTSAYVPSPPSTVNSMQVSNMQSDNCNRKKPGLLFTW